LNNILIQNAILVTMDRDRPQWFTGDLLVENNIITRIVKRPEKIVNVNNATVLNGDNYLFMPGLINTHGHAAMTLFRGYADDLSLKEWLEDKIWPIEEHLNDEDVYWGTMLAACEMLKGGTTTFTDMYFFMDRAADAAADSGIRAVLSRGMIGIGESAEIGLTETKRLIEERHGTENGRLNVILGPHAPYTCPPEFLKRVLNLAEETGRPLNIHLSETKNEVDESYATYGKSPIELVNEIGLFNYHVLAAHCVHLSELDLEILAENNVGVAHNPVSNLKLGSGIARVADMLRRGIVVGIGTDGVSSNNNLDMIEEMRTAALLQKGVRMDPALISAETALQMATINGAKVLHLEKVGMLKEGWKADIIGLNIKKPHLVPLHNPLAHIVYSASASDVEYVIVDGSLLLDKGEMKLMDEEKILKEASKHAQNLVEATKRNKG